MSFDIFGELSSVYASGIRLYDVDNFFLRKDGHNSATNDIDIDAHKLINVADPTNPQDASTKNYVDNNSQKSTYLGLDKNSSFSSLGLKSQILPTGLSGASGILRRLWIAVNNLLFLHLTQSHPLYHQSNYDLLHLGI